MTMLNLHSRHLGFLPKGLAYDFGSKSQISLNFVNGQIEPGIMFVDVLTQNQSNFDKIRTCQI